MTTQRDPEDLFEGGSDRAAYVRQMFGEISHRYDLVNRVMTVGQDQSWRRLAASQIVRPGDTVLDAGTGTGDLAFACLDAGASRVVGIDVAGPMLEQARAKSQKRRVDEVSGFSLGDATRLPLPDASVDAWCSAFVVRNIPDLPAAFSEAYRVLKPGGRLAVLEIPRMEPGLLRPFARIHFRHVVPRIGRAITGHSSAYRYLPVSVDHFLAPRELTELLRETGFVVTQVRMLMFRTVAMHVAVKPDLGAPRVGATPTSDE
ncbi:MAG: ubiquinone/menaquinone biosynthesis methyltransferase [Dehalococcoidia bacterium]|nr:ubiquinone/menaquinone biosynthesis methyltransferase [Dehalococcoidia bacterium]MCB9484446.1 ubiquinone/menaquinone biosynthesis methyltransferase [Dehalococcoidia bacterium]